MRPLLFCGLLLASSVAADSTPTWETAADGFIGTFVVGRSDEDNSRCAPSCALFATPAARVQAWPARAPALTLFVTANANTQVDIFLGLRGRVRVLVDGAVLAEFQRFTWRDDDLRIPLELATGPHRITFEHANVSETAPMMSVRWVTNGVPGLGELLGNVPAQELAEAALNSWSVSEEHTVREALLVSELRGSRPAGGVVLPLTLNIDGDARQVEQDFLVSRPIPERGPIYRRIALGRRTLAPASLADLPLARAVQQLLRSPRNWPPRVLWHVEQALEILRTHDPDTAWRDALRRELLRFDTTFERNDPSSPTVGYHRMAFRSRLDDSLQPYELFIPSSRRPAAGFPLLITLHGFKGNAGDYFRNTFGLARAADDGESLDAHGRTGRAPSGIWGGDGPVPRFGPMVVIAPQARGQTQYRDAGEIDVFEAIEDVRRFLPIDPRRIYVTGGSMGGTGTAYLAYRHPDFFAAGAALAGYHDQRVRQDTVQDALTQGEDFLRALRSDVDWAENGLHFPTLLVRGTRDLPLAWTRTLATRLRALNYPFEHREPVLGHNVWTETYAAGAIFTWLGRHSLPQHPRRVRLRTARERTDRSHWVRIDARQASDQFAEVDATLTGSLSATVRTSGVDGFSLDNPFAVSADGAGTVRLQVDGAEFELPAQRLYSFGRENGTWRVLDGPIRRRKHAHVSGPIRDIYHERLVFVVGTADPRHTWINRAVAEHWAHPDGWDVHYPIVDDTAVTKRDLDEATLVLIGPPRSNALHARFRRELPVTFTNESVMLAGQTFTGAEVGVVYVHPHPDDEERSIVLISGATPLGTWRSLFLPDILPDIVIYNEEVESGRGQWSCGGARIDDGSLNFGGPASCAYLQAGFFDMNWSWPASNSSPSPTQHKQE